MPYATRVYNEKPCVVCGLVFQPKGSRDKTCCPEHRLVLRREFDNKRRVRPERACEVCRKRYQPGSGRNDQRTCARAWCKAIMWACIWGPQFKVAYWWIACRVCGKGSLQGDGRNRYCAEHSGLSYYLRNRDIVLANTYLRHKRMRQGQHEEVDFVRVYERDGWVCCLCYKPVHRKPTRKHDPLVASPDHRVPIALGGSHTYDNIQCSHLMCNRKKHDKLVVCWLTVGRS